MQSTRSCMGRWNASWSSCVLVLTGRTGQIMQNRQGCPPWGGGRWNYWCSAHTLPCLVRGNSTSLDACSWSILMACSLGHALHCCAKQSSDRVKGGVGGLGDWFQLESSCQTYMSAETGHRHGVAAMWRKHILLSVASGCSHSNNGRPALPCYRHHINGSEGHKFCFCTTISGHQTPFQVRQVCRVLFAVHQAWP